jgi:hypothetical protein
MIGQSLSGRGVAIVLLLAIIGATPVDGAITYLSQNRRIHATGEVNGQMAGRESAAPNFGPFDLSWTQVLGQNNGVAFASQNSQLLPEAIVMDGVARATLNPPGPIPANVLVMTFSSLDITFLLDTATPFRLEHSHTGIGNNGSWDATLRLDRVSGPASGNVLDWRDERNEPSTWPSSPLEGMLIPAQYRLRIGVNASRSNIGRPDVGGINESQVSVAFTIPAPGSGAILTLFGLGCQHRRRRA